MFSRLTRPNPDTCPHEQTLAVRTYGLERVICESCGHVSFTYHEDITGTAERSRFARESERLESEGADLARHIDEASIN